MPGITVLLSSQREAKGVRVMSMSNFCHVLRDHERPGGTLHAPGLKIACTSLLYLGISMVITCPNSMAKSEEVEIGHGACTLFA